MEIEARDNRTAWWLAVCKRASSWLGGMGSFLLFVVLSSSTLVLVWLLAMRGVLEGLSSAPEKLLALFLMALLFTTVFYFGLRYAVRALLDKSTQLARSSLRVQFTVAFLAFSLPSLAFHALVGGVAAHSLGRISNQQYLKILNQGEYMADILDENGSQQLQKFMTDLQLALPIDKQAYRSQDWMIQSLPDFRGGVWVYNSEHLLLSRWISHRDVADIVVTPEPEHFIQAHAPNSAGVLTSRQVASFQVRSLLQPLHANPSLSIQLLQIYPARLAETLEGLKVARNENIALQKVVNRAFWFFMAAMTVLILLSTFLIARHLTPYFTNPVEHLVDATRKVSGGDLQHRITKNALINASQDLQELMSAFNQMSGRLHRNHQELEARALMVEMLLEHVDSGIVALDVKGQVSALNGATQKMLPHIPSDWKGLPMQELLGKELTNKIQSMRQTLRENNRSEYTSNFTMRGETEDVVLELGMVELPTDSGHETLLMLRNATAMQRTQRTLAWREVARRMAHEIKNPLTPIQLCAQRIQRKSQDLKSENAQVVSQCTSTIIQQVHALKNMVNSFSQFAKLPEAAFQNADLNLIVEESAQLYQASLSNNMKLTLRLADDLPILLLDQEQVHRALINLLDNAVAAFKATNSKIQGQIIISTCLLNQEQQVQLSIQDSGVGVPSNLRRQIFEPYITSKPQGAGLGLSIVNQIMLDHQGSVAYHPVAQGGSLFILTFPIPKLQQTENTSFPLAPHAPVT